MVAWSEQITMGSLWLPVCFATGVKIGPNGGHGGIYHHHLVSLGLGLGIWADNKQTSCWMKYLYLSELGRGSLRMWLPGYQGSKFCSALLSGSEVTAWVPYPQHLLRQEQ